MIIEVIVAVQIFILILIGTHIAKAKRLNNERLAEIRRLNYMADDSSSSMEEGFDIDFDKRQKVWQSKHTSRIVNNY